MGSYQVWPHIDQLAFYENSIFIEACARSQVVEEDLIIPGDVHATNDLNLPWARNFLDDFALVASGPGDASNIAAACLELDLTQSGGGGYCTIRVAKNSNFSAQGRSRLSRIAQVMNRVREKELSIPEGQDLCFDIIATGCQRRILKQIRGDKSLGDLVSQLPFDPVNPTTDTGSEHGGKAEDSEALGASSARTHDSDGNEDSLQLAARRWTEMRQLADRLQGTTDIEEIKRLARLAYDVRHSQQLRAWLKFHCQQNDHSRQQDRASRIIDRLGNIAKFFRSAVSIINAAASSTVRALRIRVATVPSRSRQINILRNHTVDKMKERIPALKWKTEGQVANVEKFLRRWQKYIVHAELLLLIFYEEHPGITPAINYIGVSKRSCSLCANFIRSHGTFAVEGQHKQLYCLWTLPAEIKFRSRERNANFARALDELQVLVARRVAAASARFYRSADLVKESVANFSRVTVLPLGRSEEVLGTDIIEEAEEGVATVASSTTLVEGTVEDIEEDIEEDVVEDTDEDTEGDTEDDTDSSDHEPDIQPEHKKKTGLETVQEVAQEDTDTAESISVPTSATVQEPTNTDRPVLPIALMPLVVPPTAGLPLLQDAENEIPREGKRRRRADRSPRRSRRDNFITQRRRRARTKEKRPSTRTPQHTHRRLRKRKETESVRSSRVTPRSPVTRGYPKSRPHVKHRSHLKHRSHSTRISQGRGKRRSTGCLSIIPSFLESLKMIFAAAFQDQRS